MEKYRLLRERVLACGAFSATDLHIPEAATVEDLCLAHDRGYVQRMLTGAVSAEEMRLIGFPWSPEMVERSRRSSGATLAAARAALEEGVAANLAGGTHHAFADHGEGFSVFNDAAVALRALQHTRCIARGMVVDLDVHQGNGTASIFRGDPSVFTFSMHGARNYPFRREVASDLDVDLPDGTGDHDYMDALHRGLTEALGRCRPDLAIYLAGADPFVDDRLGRLALTKAGLIARDEYVLASLRAHGVPVAIVMAGGYARNIADSVEIHCNTLRVAVGHG
jgi:acetoin utilization deacetylase AcuC-like enzyme